MNSLCNTYKDREGDCPLVVMANKEIERLKAEVERLKGAITETDSNAVLKNCSRIRVIAREALSHSTKIE